MQKIRNQFPKNDKNQTAVWILLVKLSAIEGDSINHLMENDELEDTDYVGAWANILIKAPSIHESLDILPKGLEEKGFKVDYIDKVESTETLIEYNELNMDIIEECEWLIKSDYVFKISYALFPFSNENL